MKVCDKCGAPCDGSSRFCMECGAELGTTVDPLLGKTIGGSFLVKDVLGVGGMGRVYRGEQNILGRSVAIKVIHPHLLSDEQTVQRFYTEARAASRLNHPNSVSVIDFGQSNDGMLYLVMEFLDGNDLSKVAEEQGPLAVDRVLDITSQVLDALEEAHALGIVHRDLKPENVVVLRSRAGQERVKVLDFGLATVVGIGSSVTRPGFVCGTPAYMSPEQAKGEQVDARSDLYSVGAMLYELLTDSPPFSAESPVKLLLKHVHEPVPNPALAAPHRGIANKLAAVVMRSLAKNPADRFQSAVQMKQALAETKGISSATADRPRPCVACGAPNDRSQRYCGSCGARLPGFVTGQTSRKSLNPSRATRTVALVGRDEQIARLAELQRRAVNKAVFVRLEGESGSGRTRMLEETAARAVGEGDVAIYAGRHPLGIPVAYAMATSMLRDLLGVAPEASLLSAVSGMKLGPLVRAGFEELESPSGLRGIEGTPRVGAVAGALLFAIRQARMRASTGRVTLAIDDFDRVDDLSRAAVRGALLESEGESLFVVAVGEIEGVFPEIVMLAPLDRASAAASLGETDPGQDADFSILPGVLAEIAACGETLAEYFARGKPSAADLASSRLDRLSVVHRRILQGLSALGRRTRVPYLKEVSRLTDLEAVGELVQKGILYLEDEEVGYCDALLAEIIALGTPAEARRALHSTALDVALENGMPQDVVAEHAALASDGMRTLLFMERAGDAALRRGDVHGAVRIFRRGAEIARSEALMTGEMMFDAARVSFSRKLGESMVLAGQHVMADGFLREVLDLSEIDRSARARVHLAVARVARERGRLEECARQIRQCMELGGGKNVELDALAQYELGELRIAMHDWPGAVDSFTQAIEALAGREADKLTVARAQARLVDVAVASRDAGALKPALTKLELEAQRAEAPALAARSLLRVATAGLGGSDPAIYDRALAFAAQAGDADTFRAVAARMAK